MRRYSPRRPEPAGMEELASLLRRQLAADVRGLQRRVRQRGSAQQRLSRLRTIADVRDAARRVLPRVVYDFIEGAAMDELAVRRNRQDLEALTLAGRALVDVSSPETGTTVLGSWSPSPLLGAPTALSGLVHPDGEVALARALQRDGSPYVLSGMSSYSIEEVAAAAPGPRWFQLYVWKDRGFVLELLQRAAAAGYRALVVTVDAPRSGARERDLRNGLRIPPRITARALLDGALHPRWTASFVHRPRIFLANMPQGRGSADGAPEAPVLADELLRQLDPSLTWRDVSWIREQWAGPVVIKGLMRADDALSAVEVGADAVWVSNHGGRQLDDAPSAISVLPAVVQAVAGRAEVYFDSGIRRGSDVVKALALGAQACFVGRPLLYGLAVAGEEGAVHALHILRQELALTLALTGCASIHDIASASLLGPAELGESGRASGSSARRHESAGVRSR